jgi:hypothetical protein
LTATAADGRTATAGAAAGDRSNSLMYEYQPEPTNDTSRPVTDQNVAMKPPNTAQPAHTTG